MHETTQIGEMSPQKCREALAAISRAVMSLDAAQRPLRAEHRPGTPLTDAREATGRAYRELTAWIWENEDD